MKKKSIISDLGFAKVDHDRERRQGYPEIILGEGKTPAQLLAIAKKIHQRSGFVLATRCRLEHVRALRPQFRDLKWHEAARIIQIGHFKGRPKPSGWVGVLAAGTSDLPIAEEAAVTLHAFGITVERIYDVGVAGLHRLLAHEEKLRKARALIVVAGMEGALPSVVAGLTPVPVIAVPTSVGYGASYQGIAALLGMLNSCGSGVTVVNIDNGFGAAFAVARILNHGES